MSIRKSIKILVLGVGSIGRRHIENLRALGYKNIAVYDPALSSPYRNAQEALKTEKPQVVFVCAPTSLHVPLADKALDWGADVFIEKPLSHNLAGVGGLIRKAARKKKIVMVACNYRFNRGFQTFFKILKSGRFGKPLLARGVLGYYLPQARPGRVYKNLYAAKKKGGGVVLDSGSHGADYLRSLFGEIQDALVFKSSSRSLGIEAEEAATILFRHKNGLLVSYELDFISRKPTHRLEVITTEGLLTWNFREDYVGFEDEKQKKILYRGPKDLNQMYLGEFKHFFKCLKTRQKPLQDLEGGAEVIKILAYAEKN